VMPKHEKYTDEEKVMIEAMSSGESSIQKVHLITKKLTALGLCRGLYIDYSDGTLDLKYNLTDRGNEVWNSVFDA